MIHCDRAFHRFCFVLYQTPDEIQNVTYLWIKHNRNGKTERERQMLMEATG